MSVCKICVVIPGFSDGGAQKQCIFLLNELQKDPELQITLIYFYAGVHEHLLERSNLTVIHMPVKSNYDPRNILKLRALLRKAEPNILMTWLHSCDVLGFFVRRAAPRMRWLMTERDSSYPLELRYRLRRMLGRYADGIVANSDKGREYWRRAGARGALHVVSNIVRTASAEVTGPRPLRVATIGRLEAQKNAVTVVRAFCRVAELRTDIAFAVIGQGSETEALRAVVQAAGVDDRVLFLGFRDDVDRQIAQSAVIVSMSHHEGLPNAMLESVAGNRLVVASDIPEHRALLGDTYPYLVVERDNYEQVAAKILLAVEHRENTIALDSARERLTEMKPYSVSERYKSIFRALRRSV